MVVPSWKLCAATHYVSLSRAAGYSRKSKQSIAPSAAVMREHMPPHSRRQGVPLFSKLPEGVPWNAVPTVNYQFEAFWAPCRTQAADTLIQLPGSCYTASFRAYFLETIAPFFSQLEVRSRVPSACVCEVCEVRRNRCLESALRGWAHHAKMQMYLRFLLGSIWIFLGIDWALLIGCGWKIMKCSSSREALGCLRKHAVRFWLILVSF